MFPTFPGSGNTSSSPWKIATVPLFGRRIPFKKVPFVDKSKMYRVPFSTSNSNCACVLEINWPFNTMSLEVCEPSISRGVPAESWKELWRSDGTVGDNKSFAETQVCCDKRPCTFASEIPQLQCVMARRKICSAFSTWLAVPEIFAWDSSASQSSSLIPVDCNNNCRVFGVMKCLSCCFGTWTTRNTWPESKFEKFISSVGGAPARSSLASCENRHWSPHKQSFFKKWVHSLAHLGLDNSLTTPINAAVSSKLRGVFLRLLEVLVFGMDPVDPVPSSKPRLGERDIKELKDSPWPSRAHAESLWCNV